MEIKDILALREGNIWYLVGNTYDRRDFLKAQRCFWDAKHNCWAYRSAPNGGLSPAIANMATEVIQGDSKVPDPVIVEAVKVVENLVPINKARYKRGIKKHAFKGKRWQKLLDVPVTSESESFVKPSYWNDLLLYMTPGESRPCIALVGPAGNGKTTTAEKVFQTREIPYIVIDCTEFVEPAELIGDMSYDPVKGRVWVDGKVTKAFRMGYGIIFNEFDALNPRAALVIQSALQDPGLDKQGRYLTLVGNPDEDRVYPAGECSVIITMNTFGTGATRLYVGRNTLDAATMDRITVIETVYENDAKILRAHGWQAVTANKLEKWAADIRKKIDDHALRVILSHRTLLRIAQAVERYGWEFQVAVEKEFFKRLEGDIRTILMPPPPPPKPAPRPVVEKRKPNRPRRRPQDEQDEEIALPSMDNNPF